MRNKINNRRVLGAALLAALSGQAVAAKAPDLTELFDQFWSPTRLGPAECRAGVLSATPLLLPRCMQASNSLIHLQMLNDIAQANGGNRAAGLSGYQATLDYVQATLESAGYTVSRQAFPFSAFYPQGPGVLQSLAPTP